MSHAMSQINASAVQTKSSVVPHIDIDEISQPAFLLTGHKVKCVTLNVSGLHNKLKHGILDQYLANFHIISLVETNTDSPGLKDSILNNFTCIAKKKIKQNSRYKYGGIHGICTIVSPEFKDKIMAIPETESECTLWLKLKLSEKDECILGVVYMPCETSRFYDDEMFSQIENDIVTLKARYKIPICLSGDFNAHTGQDDDFINPDDFLADITGCDMLGEEIMKSCNELNPNFTCYRYSQDKAEVNRNGKQLLSLCQGLNLKIVNGRLGSDKYLGGSTCQKTNGSVIDYVIVCEDMLPYVSDFNIEMFDSCMSDVHSPLEFVLVFNHCDETVGNKECFEEDRSVLISQHGRLPNVNKKSNGLPNMKFQWNAELAIEFQNVISNTDFTNLSDQLDTLSQNITEDGVNQLCQCLNEKMIETATKAGVYKEMNTSNHKKGKVKSPSPPWFDHECLERRKQYYKVKNTLKRTGAKTMCYKKAKELKKFLKMKKKAYYKKLNHKIRTLRSTNSKDYWTLLNKSTESNKVHAKICIETFMEHFKKLNQNDAPVSENEAQNVTEPGGLDESNDLLNESFNENEIGLLISRLKKNKACGIDLIRNEFLKKAPPEFIAFICKFFNIILSSGQIPDIWCQGLIMPLYKSKGSPSDPDNYRGITLLSCLGKLFTACLSSRISNYMYKDGKIGVEQAGFRPDFSTMDHVFTLHAIIEYYKSIKGRVYCAFIDYSKAFDLIDRASLWSKMLKNGVNGKILSLIYNMYNKAKSCVKSGNKISEFFSCNMGVRQGENLSPILFAIYLNDFKETMSNNFTGLSNLDSCMQNELETFMRLYVLLYADDTIILAESAEELQEALNGLSEYCKKWYLKTNVSKTKIIIFSRGKVRKFPKFYLDQDEIEVVDDYVYLGVKFNYNGSFKKAINKQISQARKAMFALLEKAKVLNLPIDIVCELFDVCVVPVLLYGCEVWGFEDLKDVEIFYRKFLRIILKSFKFTPNVMLYGETGSMDMTTKIHKRMIHFWLKLKFSPLYKFSSLICHLMSKKCLDNPESNHFKWCQKIKATLDEAGFSSAWDAQELHTNYFKEIFSQRCNDIFLQKWKEKMQENSQCTNYLMFKQDLQIEKYLLSLDNSLKYNLAKFRTRTHHLPVTKARFNKVDPIDVSCPLCESGKTGDEYHYLFTCEFFRNSRAKFIPKCLMSNENPDRMKKIFMDEENLGNIARFAKTIMKVFTFKRNLDIQPPSKKNTTVTRSGRQVKPPTKLNLWIDIKCKDAYYFQVCHLS